MAKEAVGRPYCAPSRPRGGDCKGRLPAPAKPRLSSGFADVRFPLLDPVTPVSRSFGIPKPRRKWRNLIWPLRND